MKIIIPNIAEINGVIFLIKILYVCFSFLFTKVSFTQKLTNKAVDTYSYSLIKQNVWGHHSNSMIYGFNF